MKQKAFVTSKVWRFHALCKNRCQMSVLQSHSVLFLWLDLIFWDRVFLLCDQGWLCISSCPQVYNPLASASWYCLSQLPQVKNGSPQDCPTNSYHTWKSHRNLQASFCAYVNWQRFALSSNLENTSCLCPLVFCLLGKLSSVSIFPICLLSLKYLMYRNLTFLCHWVIFLVVFPSFLHLG